MDITVFLGTLTIGIIADFLMGLYRDLTAKLFAVVIWSLGALLASWAAVHVHDPRLLLLTAAGIPFLGRSLGHACLIARRRSAWQRARDRLLERYG